MEYENDIDEISVIPTSKQSTSCSQENNKRKADVPPSDAFASKKKKSLDKIETVMQQSAETMRIVAASLADSGKDGEEKTMEHPYIGAIRKAFEEVPKGKEFECFMAIMEIIKRFKG